MVIGWITMSTPNALFLLMLLSAASGGAMQPAPPNPAELQALPIVRMGRATGEHKNYILYVPKGQGFPVQLSFTGKPLKGKIQQVLRATLKQDLYLYQHWGSYDGKHWQPLRQMLGIGLSMGMDNKQAFIKVELTQLGK